MYVTQNKKYATNKNKSVWGGDDVSLLIKPQSKKHKMRTKYIKK